MSDFLVCMNAILPIILIMLLGFLARCLHFLNEDDVLKINSLAFKAFIPFMVFQSMYSSDLSSAEQPKLILFAVTGVLFVFAVSVMVTLMFCKNKKRQSVIIQGLFRSNFVIIGFPIASAVMAGADMGAVAVLLATVVPLFNVLAVIGLAVFGGQKVSIGEVLLDIVKNPIIVGTVVGIAFMVSGWKLPAPIERTVANLGAVASPLLLFLLGAFFTLDRLKESASTLALVCMGRLVIIPGIVLTVAYYMGFRGMEFVALLGVFASSTAVNSFAMAQQMGGDGELAGNIVIATSALCPFTLFAWLMLFKGLGVF